MVDVVHKSYFLTHSGKHKVINANEVQEAMKCFGKAPGPNGIPKRAMM